MCKSSLKLFKLFSFDKGNICVRYSFFFFFYIFEIFFRSNNNEQGTTMQNELNRNELFNFLKNLFFALGWWHHHNSWYHTWLARSSKYIWTVLWKLETQGKYIVPQNLKLLHFPKEENVCTILPSVMNL